MSGFILSADADFDLDDIWEFIAATLRSFATRLSSVASWAGMVTLWRTEEGALFTEDLGLVATALS